MSDGFELWYSQNKNYYHVKHFGEEKSMRAEAMIAYRGIQNFRNQPKTKSGKALKKKPNPYGFDRI